MHANIASMTAHYQTPMLRVICKCLDAVISLKHFGVRLLNKLVLGYVNVGRTMLFATHAISTSAVDEEHPSSCSEAESFVTVVALGSKPL